MKPVTSPSPTLKKKPKSPPFVMIVANIFMVQCNGREEANERRADLGFLDRCPAQSKISS